MDPEEIARAKLSQREAALMRMEGENYLLSAKVQQLERKCVKSGREVHGLSCQLSQALRALGSTRGGTDGRSQRTERAYTAVATVRDGLQRLAAERPECASPPRSYLVGSTPNKAEDKRNNSFNTAMSLLKDENAKLRAELRSSSENTTKLQKAVEALETERQQRQAFEAEARASAAALEAENERTAALRSEWSHAREEAEGLKNQILELQAHRSSLEGRLLDFESREEPKPSSLTAEGGSCALGADDAAKASTALATAIDGFQPSGSNELLSKDALLWRQREMLIRLLRRDAELQLEMSTLRDDVTRRDVQIHNFKQELQSLLNQQRHEHHRGSPSDASPALTTVVADEEHDVSGECTKITTGSIQA
eukprot:gnl/MRDRNA2_/MRDRNA2_40027_c0_seq2.p1 gnl/MRDRNA2_/MRDRNA2_40027_c0~~gnl/MRDRNA2_/MRDRNA2_40027_c0_seq2.p1  ORF type:complete len:381 (-),score=84.10 gnl/MRDRNA2_/MRDRNA2_40027_c0_seq2:45-1148(-)